MSNVPIKTNSEPREQEINKNRPSALAAYRALGYSKIPRSPPLLRGKPQLASTAITAAPIISQLLERSRDSEQRLQALKSLLPPPLRDVLKASTLDSDSWCLLVPNNSVMAKLKHMLPSLAAHLRSKGFHVQTIRLRIEGR